MSISRRDLVKGLGGLGVLAAAGTAKAGGGPQAFPGFPGRVGLLHDTTLCVGCRSCEVACNEVNELPPPEVPPGEAAIFEEERRTTNLACTVVNRYETESGEGKPVFRKHQCMHCNEPCCASVCLVGAFTKTPEGPVLYDKSVCIGCRYCVMACPYYALAYEYDKPINPEVIRCTMCYDRIVEGGMPACAEVCPNGAITFGKRDELITLARERIRKYPERYHDHIFGEHEFGGTSWMTLAGTSFHDLGLPEGVTHASVPDMGSRFLSVVPLVVTIYPGLMAGFYAFTKRREKISQQEAEAKVVEALMGADEETKKKLEAAATSAKKGQERAIAAAVKKALADAAAKEEAEKGGDA